MLLNKLSYDTYLEMKEDYVEVDCTVIEVDDIKRTVRIAYTYQNVEYYAVFETTEYKLMDNFIGVIKPEEPTKLRFDNGYSMWNIYTYAAIILTLIALFLDILILKRLLISKICKKQAKENVKVIGIKTHWIFHYLIIDFNGKKYKSEFFTTHENIALIGENAYVDFYQKNHLYYIDLKTYKNIR